MHFSVIPTDSKNEKESFDLLCIGSVVGDFRQVQIQITFLTAVGTMFINTRGINI